MKLESLYTVLITPFDPQGNLDKEGLRKNIRFQLKHSIKGIVVLGTTGEAPTLTSQEKRNVIEIAIEEVKGKAQLLVGTGSYSTQQTLTATREAKEMGADGALIVTPYYNKPTQEGLYRHFATLCDALSFPICIYNIQGRTGQNLETATLQRLFGYPSIIGVKESSGNIMQINEVLGLVRKSYPEKKILSGDDALTLPLMALGGHGVFSVASNLIPGPLQKLVEASANGDFNQACTWHYQLLRLLKALFIETNPIPIKAAMELCGMPAGKCRLPLCDLSSHSYQHLKETIHSLPKDWISKWSSEILA